MQCSCFRYWTAKEKQKKKECTCTSYLQQCLDDGDGYKMSCVYARDGACKDEVVQETCSNLSEHGSTTFKYLCCRIAGIRCRNY